MNGRLEVYRGTNWWDFSDMAMRLSLLFQDRKAELDLNDEVFEVMKGELEKRRGTDRWYFSRIAMHLSLLFPDRKADLNLDDAAFEGMRGKLEENRGKNWRGFSEMAMRLCVFASERAQITHDGRILITPKLPKLSSEPKPLPERLTI